MPIHSRWITVGVASGLLALMGASLLRAQQQPEPRRDTLQTGAVTQDTTHTPSGSVDKPGIQAGPTPADSGKGHGKAWKKKGTAADSTRAKQDSTPQ